MLQELIVEMSGKRVPVRPVVVFPGWFVVPTAEAKSSDVWILNPKQLPPFIENSHMQWAEADAHFGRVALEPIFQGCSEVGSGVC